MYLHYHVVVWEKTTMSVACAKAHALQGRLGNEDFEFWEE